MRETGAGTSEMVSRGGATASICARLATGRLKWRRQAIRLQLRPAPGSSGRARGEALEIGLAIALCFVETKVGEVDHFGVCADIEFFVRPYQRRSRCRLERSGGCCGSGLLSDDVTIGSEVSIRM
jgi:hypothetical protein